MPGKVPKEVTREREVRAWEMRQQCWTQERIAEALGIDQSTVSKMLKRLNARYLKQVQAEIEQRKAEQTMQLEAMAAAALAAWERSRQDAVEVRTTNGKDGLIETITTRGQSGDPRHIQVGMQALADIRKIWGMEAPRRNEITGKDGGPLEVEDAGLTDEERAARIEALFERARARRAGQSAQASDMGASAGTSDPGLPESG